MFMCVICVIMSVDVYVCVSVSMPLCVSVSVYVFFTFFYLQSVFFSFILFKY